MKILGFKFKKLSFVTALCLTLSSNLVASGIPVVDGAALSQKQMEWFEIGQRWLKQIDTWEKELEHRKAQVQKWADDAKAYADELYTKTGVRDVVSFGKEMKDLYDEARKFGVDIYQIGKNFKLSKLDEYAWDLFIEFGGKDTCSKLRDISRQNLCKASIISPFKQVKFLENRIGSINDEMADINKLLKETQKNHGKNENIKNSQDLANQIALLQLKLDTNERAFKAQQEQLQRQSDLLKEKQLNMTISDDGYFLLQALKKDK